MQIPRDIEDDSISDENGYSGLTFRADSSLFHISDRLSPLRRLASRKMAGTTPFGVSSPSSPPLRAARLLRVTFGLAGGRGESGRGHSSYVSTQVLVNVQLRHSLAESDHSDSLFFAKCLGGKSASHTDMSGTSYETILSTHARAWRFSRVESSVGLVLAEVRRKRPFYS